MLTRKIYKEKWMHSRLFLSQNDNIIKETMYHSKWNVEGPRFGVNGPTLLEWYYSFQDNRCEAAPMLCFSEYLLKS